ncbi:AAA-ATPase ASD, mitochondrial-like isoform X2 [Solanum verrucosum]|nr:AAA-ATPase ASD, mitochondrial-like isoform X2 [Solanum verrucosum]
MFAWTMYQNYFPHELRGHLRRYTDKLVSYIYPYIHITFHEYETDGWFERSKAYVAIERYLSKNSSIQAKRLKASVVKDGQSLVLSMDDHEEVTDDYEGAKVWWISSLKEANRPTIALYAKEDENRYFKLKFHRKNRDLITISYLKYVLDEGKAISVRERQRKLYTNNKGSDGGFGGYNRRMWSQVVFEHPSTFDTLAMEPNKKQEIKDDLETFSKSKDYYAKIGKAWKRGYLLYGPPGTGKSSMIAAMANFLQYDVYDLELTAVKDNTELRKLLIDTTSKSIIVIEDIDCSLDLTGQRKPKKEKEKDEKVEKDPIKEELKKAGEEKKQSEVTLSGLLNFIDGLWSAIGGERLIVFTTNFVEKLDPALIRRGRMDKHIELSYCCFESFKVLANNYLDVTSHDDYFPEIRRLLGETNITPADVAESLMPKSSKENASTCLERLIKAIETAKVEAKLKAEEEKAKAEKEKEKEENENEKKKKDAAAAEEAKSADDVNENGASMETTSVKEKPESDGAKENGKSEIVKD